MKTISVIVPVLNAARTLPACLDGLARLDRAPDEILIVDNGSTDESRRIAEAFAARATDLEVRLVNEGERGASSARNAGVRLARGEIVAFTDADCIPSPGWLSHLSAPFDDAAVGAVAGRVVPSSTASLTEFFSALYTLRLPPEPSRHRSWAPHRGGYPTANLAVRRSVMEKLGGFEPAMIYGEDFDLCARLYRLGLELVYQPEARVAHRHRITVGGLVRQAFGFGRGHAFVLRRHGARRIWVDLPRRTWTWEGAPFAAWIDLASADKKIVALAAVGAAQPWLWLLIPLYAVYLTRSVRRYAAADLTVSRSDAAALAGLLVLKSAALTAGRWWGSVRFRALCL